MRMALLLLSEITDGREAWGEFFSGLQDTLRQNAGSWPVLALIMIALIMVWLDLRVARWLVVGRKGGRKGGGEGSASDR